MYAQLQIFIQLSTALTKLCHIKRDHIKRESCFYVYCNCNCSLSVPVIKIMMMMMFRITIRIREELPQFYYAGGGLCSLSTSVF